MHTLQLDMNYVNNSGLYDNKHMDDSSEDILEGLSANIPGPSNVSRSGIPGLRLPEIELPPRAGKVAAQFVHEVNDECEEKDVRLTLLAVRTTFLYRSQSPFEYDCFFPALNLAITQLTFSQLRSITIPRFET